MVMPLIDRMLGFLNLKPILIFKEGRLTPSGAARTRSKAMEKLASAVSALGQLKHLGVMHTRLPQGAQALAKLLAEKTGFPEKKIWIAETGSVLSSHAGPEALAAVAVQAQAQKVRVGQPKLSRAAALLA